MTGRSGMSSSTGPGPRGSTARPWRPARWATTAPCRRDGAMATGDATIAAGIAARRRHLDAAAAVGVGHYRTNRLRTGRLRGLALTEAARAWDARTTPGGGHDIEALAVAASILAERRVLAGIRPCPHIEEYRVSAADARAFRACRGTIGIRRLPATGRASRNRDRGPGTIITPAPVFLPIGRMTRRFNRKDKT